MDRAAALAERTLPVLSPSFLASRFTQPEWAAAFADDPTGEKGRVVPVRVAECDPKGLLGPIVYIDLVGRDEAAAKDELLRGVRRGRAKPETPPRFPGARPTAAVAKPARFPGALPPIWNVPHHRNRRFTGHDELLDKLHQMLTEGPAALHGLAGIGKTQIAVEYAYRHAAEFDIVWWLRAEEPATLVDDYAALASELDLPQADDKVRAAVAKVVREELERRDRWLLVFDNAHEEDELRDLLPRAGSGRVIITSWNPNWDYATPLEVPLLDHPSSVEFLLKRTGYKDEAAAAGELADELGDLPLALEQAAAYITQRKLALAEYIRNFRTRRRELWREQKKGPAGHPDPVTTTLTMAVHALRAEEPAAVALLNLCSFLAPQMIPLKLLAEHYKLLPTELAEAVSASTQLGRLIRMLRRYSLADVTGADVTGEHLSFHRLVQAVTRDGLPAGERRHWVEAAVALMNAGFLCPSEDPMLWTAPPGDLLAHVLAVSNHAERTAKDIRGMGQLLRAAGNYLRVHADFKQAETCLMRARNVDETAFGYYHPDVARDLRSLGWLFKDQGNLDDAQKYFEEAVKIDQEDVHFEQGYLATDDNDLAWVLKDRHDLEGARKNFEQAREIDEAAFGPNHPNVARDLFGLGWVLKDQNKLAEARKNFERALAIDEVASGANHPTVARDLCGLGWVLKDEGNLAKKNQDDLTEAAKYFAQARKNFERALAIDEAAFESNHPSVARDLCGLGWVLWEQGDSTGAQHNLERASAILTSWFSVKHHSVVEINDTLRRWKGEGSD